MCREGTEGLRHRNARKDTRSNSSPVVDGCYAGTERAHPALWDALFAIAAPRSGFQTIDARLLGLWLRDNLGTIAAGHKLTVDTSHPA